MRWAFVLPNLSGGGAEKAVLKVAEGLLAKGHEVHLFLFEDRCDYPVPAALRVTCAYPGQPRISKGWLAKRLLAWRLSRFVRQLQPTCVVSTLPFADEIAIMARIPALWCRIANTLSAEIASLARTSPAKARRREARYRRMYAGQDLIAVSQGVADDLQQRLGLRGRIRQIPNPFDRAAIRTAASQPCADLPEQPFVLHVGRFSEQKRHDVLLDAWAKCPSGYLLVLLTHPDERLTAMIAERGLQGRVRVAGFQKNPYPWMAAADLLVLSSDREGLPNVLIEALLCGTPVVSTDCPSGPREILASALPQALVPCGDAEALAMAIEATLRQPPALDAIDLARYSVPGVVAAYESLAEPPAARKS